MHNFVLSAFVLGKRIPPQVYVGVNDWIFRLKKWMQWETTTSLCWSKRRNIYVTEIDAITNLMQNLETSKYSFLGKYSTTERDFLQKVELSFREQNFE